MFMRRKAPEPEPYHFYDGSAALVKTKSTALQMPADWWSLWGAMFLCHKLLCIWPM